jgi:hypothetical protein
MSNLKNAILSKDFLSGLIFLAVGIGVIVEARGYPMGSLLRMGPGFFPTMVGSLTAAVGAALIGKAIHSRADGPPALFVRPLFFIIAGVLVFALSLQRLGLVVSTVLLVMITRLASRPVDWIGALVLSVALAGLSVLIFRHLLGLPIRLWP